MATRIFILSLLVTYARASTHWVVTEEGKIQEQLESPFAIKQPHDLVAFMKQEQNYEQFQDMKDMLIKEKQEIEENEDRDIDLEVVHYRQDKDCKLAGKPLADFDLFISSLLPLENKDIQVSDYIEFAVPESSTELLVPNCEEIIDLSYSIHAYDHLEGVVNRKSLQYLPETGLRTTLNYMKNESEFAHAVDNALKKNSTSWIAYNLATFYWRMKGNGEKAIECVRRALHFSPAEQKDVALVNLANILHRSHYSLNASIVMTHALDISNQFNVNHFTLASIYAALGDYNKSIHYFEKTIVDQPDFEAAKKRLYAVKCQHSLQLKLEAQHESLQRTLKELQVYQVKHKKYTELQTAIEKMQINRQDQINMHFHLIQELIKEGTFDHKLCKFRSKESGPVMFCSLPTPNIEDKAVVDLNPNVKLRAQDRIVSPKEQDERGHILDAQATKYASGDQSGTFKPVVTERKVEYNNWSDPGWPKEEHCDLYAPRTFAWDEYPSSYVNPETRGFLVHKLLTSYINIAEGENHPQPWEELNCEYLEPNTPPSSMDRIPGVIDRHSAPMHKQDDYMKREMLLHVNEGRVWPGDLAHRLHTAIAKSLKKKKLHKNLWLLYNYAGLYFRVQGDNLRAVECIRRAANRTPPKHYDIPLVNMANIMYRLGKVNNALALLIEALNVNNTEPATYLAMGNALQASGNITGAITFYEYGLILHPQYAEVFHALMNVKCSALRNQKVEENLKKDSYMNNQQDKVDKQYMCDKKDDSCEKLTVAKNIKRTENEVVGPTASSNFHFTAELTSENAILYSGNTDGMKNSKATPEVDSENQSSSVESNQIKLLKELESKKEHADKIIQDADAVMNSLAEVADDDTVELSERLSNAQALMHQLSKIRDTLGSLVDQATSSLGSRCEEKKIEETVLSPSECSQLLKAIDIRSFISSNVDVIVRGYEFGEELLSATATQTSPSEPFCVVPKHSSIHSVEHLESVKNRNKFNDYDPEEGMKIVLQQLHYTTEANIDFSTIITKLSQALQDNPKSWRLSLLASHYWRLQGKAREIIDCLRHSLHYAPLEMRDIIMLSLANVFAHISQWRDALYTAEEARALNPDYFIHYFTLANIYAAKGDIKKSIPYFKKVVEMQPDLKFAKQRLQAAICENQNSENH